MAILERKRPALLHALYEVCALPRSSLMQPGDVPATSADVSDLERDVGFKPATSVEEGVKRFVEWYRGYYRV